MYVYIYTLISNKYDKDFLSLPSPQKVCKGSPWLTWNEQKLTGLVFVEACGCVLILLFGFVRIVLLVLAWTGCMFVCLFVCLLAFLAAFALPWTGPVCVCLVIRNLVSFVFLETNLPRVQRSSDIELMFPFLTPNKLPKSSFPMCRVAVERR